MTITDRYGRQWSVQGTCYSTTGITLDAGRELAEVEALERMNAMQPDGWTPPPTVPDTVTMRQARLALLHAGLLKTVDATIAAMPGVEGDAARITWEFSTEVHRTDALVQSLGPALGLTTAQLDSLFLTASGL